MTYSVVALLSPAVVRAADSFDRGGWRDIYSGAFADY
jgi:hypothetical protein